MSILLDPKLKDCRCIFFEEIKCLASIGIHPHELSSKQEIAIWLEIYIKLANSQSLSDNIKDTLDYDEINSQIESIVNTKHYSLQETLIDEIAKFCISLPSVKAVRVKTAKTQAYKNCKAVGIEVFKWR
jgi:dihydroneopterin aldolase